MNRRSKSFDRLKHSWREARHVELVLNAWSIGAPVSTYVSSPDSTLDPVKI